jgi:HD-like signal output (HDOD) protein
MAGAAAMIGGTSTIQKMAEHDAAALVQSLRADRVAGDTELPCFPQSAVRLQHLMADPEADLSELIKVISFDPVLTVTIANEMRQLTRAQSNAEIRTQLEGLWGRGAWMAAVSYVVAKNFTSLNRDQAMLAGLLHDIGKLYVLTRAVRFPFVMQDRERFRSITREWKHPAARAVLSEWKIQPEVIAAVTDFEDLNRQSSDEADLTDVVTVSYLLIGYVGQLQSLAASFDKIKAFARMRLKLDLVEEAMQAAQEEIELLRRGIA